MTLNGLIDLFLRYFAEFNGSGANVTVVGEKSISFAEYRLPLLAETDPPCSAVSLQ